MARAERAGEVAPLPPVDAPTTAKPEPLATAMPEAGSAQAPIARPEPLATATPEAASAQAPIARPEPLATAVEPEGSAPLERLAEEVGASTPAAAPDVPAALAKRFERAPTTTNGSAGTTKAQLYEQAKALGIAGRSSMSKTELEHAIASRLAADAMKP